MRKRMTNRCCASPRPTAAQARTGPTRTGSEPALRRTPASTRLGGFRSLGRLLGFFRLFSLGCAGLAISPLVGYYDLLRPPSAFLGSLFPSVAGRRFDGLRR